jgi:ferritin-like metal-binding protein YciE
MFIDNTELRLAIEELRNKTDSNSKSIELVFDYLDKLIEKEKAPIRKIGYKIEE